MVLSARQAMAARSPPNSPMPQMKSVRRDAERGGRDARAPQTATVARFKIKSSISKDVAGEGAGQHPRGRVCSPERFAPGLGGGSGREAEIRIKIRKWDWE